MGVEAFNGLREPATADLALAHHLRVVCGGVDLLDGGVVPWIFKRLVCLSVAGGLVGDLVDLCTAGCGGRGLRGGDLILVVGVPSRPARL